MFCPLEYRDTLMLMRGFLILVVVVVIGVTVSERQLNSLTQREDRIPVVALNGNRNGIYTIDVLGYHYNIRAVYPVGQIINTDRTVTIKTMQQQFILPIYIEVDCRKQLKLLDCGMRVLVKQAFDGKEKIQLAINKFRQKINVYWRQYR